MLWTVSKDSVKGLVTGLNGTPIHRSSRKSPSRRSVRRLRIRHHRKALGAYNRVLLETRSVPVERTVGSMGRYGKFDRAFLPVRASVAAKWNGIDRVSNRGEEMLPVSLYIL